MSTLADSPVVAPILTQTLDEFVKQQIAEQGFADEAEYFAKLAEEEHKRKIWEYYEQEVLRGLESGPPIPLTPEYWSDFLSKHEERKRSHHTEENL
jgi:methionyl-tRNA formyltransferase